MCVTTLTQDYINDDKDNNGGQAATSQFFGAPSGDNSPKEFIHCRRMFGYDLNNKSGK
ncbi:hypothetical protein SNE25_16025 [Mucilaginibacter sabulilitoris]|uniref:Uncharacterized protein n=1 Tax=Mucilaginibacter sabulilitoris TaxID=1173583 RepID=A0ABZ0U0W9_9SPHI|nr:hypothetical protein [Mucilaginibacter sabulilitoris]WPU97030.1 hypothetical protein SNE25_16025 [Mucilaginibacter sabulilitoris]